MSLMTEHLLIKCGYRRKQLRTRDTSCSTGRANSSTSSGARVRLSLLTRSVAHVPNLHFVGDEKTEDGKVFHVMVMDLLGKSLEDLFQECRRKFDLKSVLQIAI
jgi:hypothetical protein